MTTNPSLAADGGGGALIPPQYWILSPIKDLSLVILTPALVLLVFAIFDRIGWMEWLVAFGLVLAVAHYLPGMIRAYGDPALFARFRIRLIVVPIALFAATLTFTYLDMHAVTLVMMLWGSWHWLMQSYGFARIYDAKARSVSRTTARLDQAMCIAWFVTTAFLIHGSFTGQLRVYYLSGAPLLPPSIVDAFRMAWFGLTGVITIWWLLNVIQNSRQGNPPSPLKLIFMVATFGFLAYTNSIATYPAQGYVMFEACHDIQYLAIVWVFNRNRVDKDPGAGKFNRFLFRPRIGLALLYIGICLAFGMIRNVSKMVLLDDVIKITVALVATLAMFHYYLDGFIWKIREQSTRESIGVESEDRRFSNGADTRSTSRGLLRHALLWLFFLVPVTILSITQARGLADDRLDIARKIARSLPGSPQANRSLCRQLVESDHFGEAIEPCRTAVALLPRDAKSYFFLGNALHQTGSVDEAMANYQSALEIDADFAKAHYNRGVALQQLSRIDEATRHYQEAVRIDPRYAMAHNNLGICLATQGELEAAAEHFREALRLQPDYQPTRDNLRRIESQPRE